MGLNAEIDKERQTVKTDDTKMTLGEIINLYKDHDLIINPEFQRAFRWDSEQKSRFVESILLGIPIPSIFVAANDDGRWELVDGLQRLSTILQFFGLLEHKGLGPLVLEKTDRLPSLEGVVASEDTKEGTAVLDSRYIRDIKRTALQVQIIQRESDPKAKFDLFARINSYGSTLTYQEMLNAALYYVSPSFCQWLRTLSSNESFNRLTTFSEKERIEAYDEEIVLRFLLVSTMSLDEIRGMQNYRHELREFAFNLAAKNDTSNLDRLQSLFEKTFERMATIDTGILHKWQPDKKKYTNKFSRTAFDAIACAFGYAIYNDLRIVSDPLDASRRLWEGKNAISKHSSGIQTAARIQKVVPLGIQTLTEE